MLQGETMTLESRDTDELQFQGSISDVIMGRRTINRFLPDSAPDRDTLVSAIEHASFAPNHYLTQPWRFYLLGPDSVRQICDLNEEMVREHKGEKAAAAISNLWSQVPAWLVMTTQRSEDPIQEIEEYAACCCAAQNLMLYLWYKGFGVKWNTGKVTRDERFLRIVGADPAQEKSVGLFWLGAAAQTPKAKRKPVDAFITDVP